MTTTAQHGHHHSHHTHLHGHHSKPTHEPSIGESFVFHYDAMTVFDNNTYYISIEFEFKDLFLKRFNLSENPNCVEDFRQFYLQNFFKFMMRIKLKLKLNEHSVYMHFVR